MKRCVLAAAALLLFTAPAFAADLAAARAALAGPPSAWAPALATFQGAARAGDAGAAYWAGLMARNGKGTAPDSAAALGWLTQAAQGGVPDAMFVLANMLIAGEGGAADPVGGHAWLERAAAREHPGALQQLAQMSHEAGDGERASALLKTSAHALKHGR
ncbi:tetratricopeptide repeat protein [Pseudoduganella lutea]|uniref:Sel1 repeat family protein n=1 Tax=Pseudoduganella lutea TaxID=321985 RepID=A0A4P6L4T5_9BURK|nr:sel1 repeat family protein [Pseudoduganella lutea]QBE66621.1 sel1 repeat family protein [Pseudoduganella lutea]